MISNDPIDTYPDLVPKLRRRNSVASTVVIACGITQLICIGLRHQNGHSTVDIVELAAICGLMLVHLVRFALRNLDRRSVDEELTERAKAFSALGSHNFGTVRIDNSLEGLSRVSWERAGNNVVVSRHARDNFAPEELDFALASAVCRRESTSGTRWDLIGIVFAVMVCFPALIALTPKSMLLPGVLVILSIVSVSMAYSNKLYVARRIELDIAADEAAVDITGNVDAAESALTKLAEHSPASAKVEERLQRIRYARYRTTASPLPPVGWTPTSPQ